MPLKTLTRRLAGRASEDAAGSRVDGAVKADLPPRRRLRHLLSGGEEGESAIALLTVIAVSTTIIAVVGVAFALNSARWLLIPIATAFVISILLAPATDGLRRLHLPESVRAAIIVATSVGLVLSGVYLLSQPAIAFSERLPEIVEEARDKMTGVKKAVTAVQEVTDEVGKITDLEPRPEEPQEVVLAEPSIPAAIASSTRLILIQSLFITVLVYFLLSSRTAFRRKAMMAPQEFSQRLKIARIFRDIEKNVGSYMFTMVIINIGLGLATGVAMWLLGVPSPMIWGALAALLNFLPYIGPVTITVLLGLTGIVNFDSPLAIAAPAGAYIALNFIESNFVTPALVGMRLRLTPVAIILAISFWTWIWGPIGAVLSIPLLIILKAVCDRSDTLKPLGVFIGELDEIDRRSLSGLRIETYAREPRRSLADL